MTERWIRGVSIALGIAVTVLLFGDVFVDDTLSRTSRLLVMLVVGVTFWWVTIRQGRIARKYEGWPVTRPLAFRWVVCLWFASMGAFVGWLLTVAVWPHVYSTFWSTVVWWQFAESTLFFLTRWIAVGRPQVAGPGETGADR